MKRPRLEKVEGRYPSPQMAFAMGIELHLFAVAVVKDFYLHKARLLSRTLQTWAVCLPKILKK